VCFRNMARASGLLCQQTDNSETVTQNVDRAACRVGVLENSMNRETDTLIASSLSPEAFVQFSFSLPLQCYSSVEMIAGSHIAQPMQQLLMHAAL
jgi:hypothetical protein